MNVAFGGSVYQDIHSQAGQPLLKQQPDIGAGISVAYGNSRTGNEPATRYFQWRRTNPCQLFPPSSGKRGRPGFRATATAPDGINEAMEHTEKTIFGVQWHPEAMAPQEDEAMKALFAYHIENARPFAKAKAIHQRIVTIDSHTDTPMIFPGEFNIGEKEGGKVNLPFMEEGRIDATFMVAYIPQGKRDEHPYRQRQRMR